ncbi:TraA family conjugative transfer protein [Rhodanobacter sp. FW106-PBR-LB-2-11]|uniref:TraA family conjugative transfer protein n=1 Tax=Rhodanobacter sp. FW106-PBR-LB-2-11 TaxID=1524463 RepID=UPI0034E44C42
MNWLTNFRSNRVARASAVAVKNYGLLFALVALLTGTAFAGTTTGTTGFGTMLTTVTDWANGDLGKLLAVSAFLIGMGMGIVKQSMIAIALGIGFALALAYGPALITGIFTFAL